VAWPDRFKDEVAAMEVGQHAFERKVSQLQDQKLFREAADLCLARLEKQPTAQVHVRAAHNLAHCDKENEAIQHLHEALRLDPDSGPAHYLLALVQFRRAEKKWHQAKRLTPETEEWFRDTVKEAEIAAKLQPDNARNYLHWGLALKYLGKPKEAVVQLRKGVVCRPAEFDLQFSLGEVLVELGQFQEAKIYLENAAKLDPKDKRPREMLESLRQMKD
jgi:tetratricopeptide (TPR) repeat protein